MSSRPAASTNTPWRLSARITEGEGTRRPRRRQYEPDQDEARQDDHPPSRHQPAAALHADTRVQGRGPGPQVADRIYVEGKADQPHAWDDFEKFAADYEHPLSKSIAAKAAARATAAWTTSRTTGSSNPCQGRAARPDVNDAAAWSAVVDASVRSVADAAGRWRSPTSPGASGRRTPRSGSSRPDSSRGDTYPG